MTVLYSNDFEAGTAGSALSGWTGITGNNFLVRNEFPARGTQAFGRNSDGDTSIYSSLTPTANVCVRTAQKVSATAFFSSIGHLMRVQAGTNIHYMTDLQQISGGDIKVRFFVWNTANFLVGQSGAVLNVVAGDTIHFETHMIGNVFSAYVWKNADPKPGAPSYTVTNGDITTAGVIGLRCSYSGFGFYTQADDLVVTDGTGGEDFFYPAPTTYQPLPGAALHSDWTTALVARNEAETTATTLAAGTATRSTISDAVQFGTDAHGRYLMGVATGAGSREEWSGIAAGAERTLMVIVKRVASGADQSLIDSDDSSTRLWQWFMNAAGQVVWGGWNTGGAVDLFTGSSASVSTTEPQAAIVRIRNDAGTYKVKIWVGPTATTEVAYTGTPVGLTAPVSLGDRRGGGKRLDSKVYWWGIWNRALSDVECNALGANGWAVYDPASLGSSDATAPGATVTSAASIVVGSASGTAAGTANGVTLTAASSLIAGSASGLVNGTLNFQAAGLEFGRRTGLGVSTFALDNGASYRYTVHADGLTLGSAILTSAAITLDSAGKLPNLTSASLTPGTVYRIVAIRQADGEAATFRMTAT